MNKLVNNKSVFNARIWCLVIYIQYMTLPFKQVSDLFSFFDLIVVVICIIFSLCINGISKIFIKYFSILVIIFVVDFFLFRNLTTFTFFFIQMWKSSMLMLYCTLNLSDLKEFIRVYYKYSIVTYGLVLTYIILFVFQGGDSTSHMGIGNVMTFIFIAVLIHKVLVEQKFIWDNFLLFFILVITLFFGNRMAIISELCCLLFIMLFHKKSLKRIMKNIIIFVICFVFVLFSYHNLDKILSLITPLTTSNGNIYYSLMKFQRMFLDSDGIFAGLIDSSSGRNILYEQAIRLSKESAYFPRGIGGFYVQDITGYIFRYPHNLFLELLTTFGFMAPVIALLFVWLVIERVSVMNENQKLITMLFLIFAITKLLASSSFWLAPSFAITLGFLSIKLKDRTLNNS